MTEDKKDSNVTISVTGQHNIVTAGNQNRVEVHMQWKGNIEKLKTALAEKKVPAADIEEITAIVQEDKPDPAGNLPVKAETWMNKMLKKALDGGWEITAHTAGHLLAGFIKSYYGLPV